MNHPAPISFSAEFIAYEWAIDLLLDCPLFPGPVAVWLSAVGEDRVRPRTIEFCCVYCGAQATAEACIRGCPTPDYLRGAIGHTYVVNPDASAPSTSRRPDVEEAVQDLDPAMDTLTQTVLASALTSFLRYSIQRFETVWVPGVPTANIETERKMYEAMEVFVEVYNGELRGMNCAELVG